MTAARSAALAIGATTLMAIAGCASATSTSTERTGTVSGTVLSGPRCPGPERAGSPCPPGPVSGAVVSAIRRGDEVASTRTDEQGRFRMALPAGRYLIRATNVGGYRSTASKTVAITADGTARVTLLLDTGIR